MVDHITLNIAVAVILDTAGRMLLVRKKGTDSFMQPGGKIEAGETELQSLRREVREELGVDVQNARYLTRMIAPAANEPGHMVDAAVFSAEISGVPTVSAEIEDMCWHCPRTEHGRTIAPLSVDILALVATEAGRL